MGTISISPKRCLLVILVIAGCLRLFAWESSPPGLQVDEASNVWNAWCIAGSGFDEHQNRLPVFYTAAFGDNRSALFLYFLLPFELVLGPSVRAAHLAAGFYGTGA